MMIVKSTPRVIVPAAGFGKRMGSPESKEMLVNPRTGVPLIEATLQMSESRGWSVHVITRADKPSLIEYLEGRAGVSVQKIGPTREWPETVLNSCDHWVGENILILPDTEFEPSGILDSIAGSLSAGAPLAAAVFEVSKPAVWGLIRASDGQTEFCEKPAEAAGAKAWGVLGFSPGIGRELFTKILESSFDHEWKRVEARAEFFELSGFTDLTR